MSTEQGAYFSIASETLPLQPLGPCEASRAGHQQIDVVCRGLLEEGICHMIKVHVRRDRIVFGKEAGPKVFHHLLGGQTFRRGNLFHLVLRKVLGREFRDGGL